MAKLKIKNFRNAQAYVILDKKKGDLVSINYNPENKKSMKRIAKKLKKQLKKAA